jgi:hypothetical protein
LSDISYLQPTFRIDPSPPSRASPPPDSRVLGHVPHPPRVVLRASPTTSGSCGCRGCSLSTHITRLALPVRRKVLLRHRAECRFASEDIHQSRLLWRISISNRSQAHSLEFFVCIEARRPLVCSHFAGSAPLWRSFSGDSHKTIVGISCAFARQLPQSDGVGKAFP